MNEPPSINRAAAQLDRVLGFFPRVEAKASFVFAMNTGLLALLALNLRLEDFKAWFLIIPAGIVILMLAASLFFVYRCSFPNLKGGTDSRIYFREIAKRTESNYIAEFLREDEETHVRDLLGQVWRNSEILTMKFDAIRVAFILTALSLIPWIAFLTAAAIVHSDGLVIK